MLHCFVANLTDFSGVKKLWKSVTIWQNYRYTRVACFSDSSIQRQLTGKAPSVYVCKT